MTNTYTELLEQIVTEMKSTLLGGNSTVIDSEYRQWLDFLRQVHPESELLNNSSEQSTSPAQNARDDPSDDGLKAYSDLREIIRLAATHDHPTWYIQPHFIGSIAAFTYENNELQNALPIHGVPNTIDGFSGIISGVWLGEQAFMACEVSNKNTFVQKMEFLKKTSFATPDFVLFPTEKLFTISVSKLEASLINFISTAREKWVQVDGAVIVSDTPLFSEDNGIAVNRIIFKPHTLRLAL